MRRLLLLFLLALAPPLAAQDVSIPHTSFTLPNGLRVLVHEDHSTPLASVYTFYHVGAVHEQPGKTGFAHLFEHMMFEGSTNVPEGEFDKLLTSAGAEYNAGTGSDLTTYYITLPSSALELALWLEADRMGGLLDAVTQQKLDVQRDVVKNERRQRYENTPYGLYSEQAYAALYPPGVIYSWRPIGSMTDLTAASLEDVTGFFRRFYVPNNAVMVIAGDVNPQQVRATIERLFSWIPRGPEVTRLNPTIPPLTETRYLTTEDRVTLPQVNLAWRTGPSYQGDYWALNALGQILGQGKGSRLYRRMIYEEKTAQTVSAYNSAQLYSGDFFVRITGKPDSNLGALEQVVLEEIQKLADTPPTAEELQRVNNGLETQFVMSLGTVQGKAAQLNQYLYYTGRADYITEDLRRARAVTPADVQRVARQYLAGKHRVVISFVPQGKTNLAAQPRETAR